MICRREWLEERPEESENRKRSNDSLSSMLKDGLNILKIMANNPHRVHSEEFESAKTIYQKLLREVSYLLPECDLIQLINEYEMMLNRQRT